MSLRRLHRQNQLVSYAELDLNLDSLEHLENEDEYEPVSNSPKRTNPPKRTKNANGANKRAKSTTTRSSNQANRPFTAKQIAELESQLEENHLYLALLLPDIDVQDLTSEWIDSYNENPDDLMSLLVNLVLRCCGSLFSFQTHDLVNIESSAETVGELTLAFARQRQHKYPFKTLVPFRKNVLTFFQLLILAAHENGLLYLYTETSELSLASPLMSQLLTWLSSLSSCVVRPLRYTSTIILLAIQTLLCEVVNSVISRLEKAQRQRAKTTAKAKQKSLDNAVSSAQRQRDTINEYLGEITSVTLSHRYRDIDLLIRLECLNYLSQVMLSYPSFFFQATYLRYFGWLLSDPVDGVRTEVTRILIKLYRSKDNLTIGLRQFTERYKEQLMKMCLHDESSPVRLNCLTICCELVKIGYLDEAELRDLTTAMVSSEDLSKPKARQETARFFGLLMDSNTDELMTKHALFLDGFESDQFLVDGGSKLDVRDCLKLKILIGQLRNVSELEVNGGSLVNDAGESIISNIALIFLAVCQFAFQEPLDFLTRYILLDLDTVTFTGSEREVTEFKELLDISLVEDRFLVLLFLQGALEHTLGNKNDLSAAPVVRFVDHLQALSNLLMKNTQLGLQFLKIWNRLLAQNVLLQTFTELGQENVYTSISCDLMKFFQGYQGNEFGDFEKFFDSVTGEMTTPDMKLQVSTLLEELIAEVKDLIVHEDPEEGLKLQVRIMTDLTDATKAIVKITKLGERVDLDDNRFLNTITQNLLKPLDWRTITRSWANNFLAASKGVIEGLSSILDLALVFLSWRIERCLQGSDAKFVDFERLLEALQDQLFELDDLVKLAYEQENMNLVKVFQQLRTLGWARYVDFVTPVKIFYVQYKTHALARNPADYFSKEGPFGRALMSMPLTQDVQHQLMGLFLYKEARVAGMAGIEVQRHDEEDVNIEDLAEEKSDADSWGAQKDLCVFTNKLFTLVGLSMIDNEFAERMCLNGEAIGGIFATIVTQSSKRLKEAEKKNVGGPSEEGEDETNLENEENEREGNETNENEENEREGNETNLENEENEREGNETNLENEENEREGNETNLDNEENEISEAMDIDTGNTSGAEADERSFEIDTATFDNLIGGTD